ncbi:hypothetical protein K501DRAFT_279295 [Backusella circina FSU 941]|nr:hypothetical protein K501DRAFT_279295 [Backusella circina FSU 941]
MKPKLSNGVWIYENERNVSPSDNSETKSRYQHFFSEEPRSGLHFTDSEQRSSSLEVNTNAQAQRAPLAENEGAIFKHPDHEFDQDSMLHFETDDIISRKSNLPSHSFFSISNNQNKRDIQGFKISQSPPSNTEKKAINNESNMVSFGGSNGENNAAYSRPSLDQNNFYREYPSLPISAKHKRNNNTMNSNKQNLSRSDQNNNIYNQKRLDNSASTKKSDTVDMETSKPYHQHLGHKILGGGSDDNDIIFDSVDNNQPLQSLWTSLENTPLSTDENHEPNNRDHENLIAGKVLGLKDGLVLKDQENGATNILLQNRSGLHYDNETTTNSARFQGANGNAVLSPNKVQDISQVENIVTEKRSQMVPTCSRFDPCKSCPNYVIVKVSPIKLTHKPYDVPTLGQSLLNKAIQVSSSSLETPDSTSSKRSSMQIPDSKYKSNKPQPIHNPYDVLTLGQTIMTESTNSSIQRNDVSHSVYDVPTKAQFILQEATTGPSLKHKLNSSYCAITQSILSIPIETPPSPADSDNELLIETSTSDNCPKFKERLPLTYALDASNRALNYINNGYPPSPKSEEKEDVYESSILYDKSPSAHIKLESIEGNTISFRNPENDTAYLSDRMPGSFDFLEVPPVIPAPDLYDSLPIIRISEKDEPSIHGQTACYSTVDPVQPESFSFMYASASSKMSDIEPSIYGQSPSFYPGETASSGLQNKYSINRISESEDNEIQGDQYNKRRDIIAMYHGNQDILDETYRPLQQYEKIRSTNEHMDVSDMSMAIPTPDTIDLDDFSFKIQKPEERDRENQELAYNEVLVPAEFDEDNVEEIHPEQVETVKVKNSFFKKISLTPQQALRFYNNHSSLIDLALATNPVGAAFVVTKDVNKQRLKNKKARLELAAEKAAHPERFIEEMQQHLSFKERIKNAPKGAVKMMNENQGYINAALAATPGGRALDAAKLANKYARRGVDSYTHACSLHAEGFKKTSQKFALDNIKSYTDPFIPSVSMPKTFSGVVNDKFSSFIPGHTTKTLDNTYDIPQTESPLAFNHDEYFMNTSINNETAATCSYQTLLNRNLSPIPQEGPMSIDIGELPSRTANNAKNNNKIRRATTDSIATKNYNEAPGRPVGPIKGNMDCAPKTVTPCTFNKDRSTGTNILEPNTSEHEIRTKSSVNPTNAKKDRKLKIITDPATMKSYTLYNCSETNVKKAANFDDSKNIYQNGNNKAGTSGQKKPKLHARLYSTPIMKDTISEDNSCKYENMDAQPDVREIPMKNGSIFVPIEAFDHANFTTYISGHLENRKGSLQKTMGRIVQNDKMKDSGDRMKLSGKTKIKVYQFKRKSL